MTKKTLRAITALEEAQKIAFAPFVFQTTVSLRKLGVFDFIFENRGDGGPDLVTISNGVSISSYGIGVLLEIATSAGLVSKNDQGGYELTKTGYFLNYDKTVNVNINFAHDVCYKGLYHLTEAIEKGTPSGLRELGNWATIYEGLSQLPEHVQKSWFAFDHHYSDGIFEEALDRVLCNRPSFLLDIGGNTGRFAICCCEKDANISVTIVDLPGQLQKALIQVEKAGYSNRINGFQNNWLEADPKLPEGADIIWMSQFLDCFSEAEIMNILKVCRKSMQPHTELLITETFTDRQQFDNARFVLEATSVYFTALANGNSKMYTSEVLIRLIENAGLRVTEDIELGAYHTMLVCKKGID